MNREEIIRMAEKCGLPEFENNESQASNLEAFAALIRADEREACAKVCDEVAESRGDADECSTEIRARGEA